MCVDYPVYACLHVMYVCMYVCVMAWNQEVCGLSCVCLHDVCKIYYACIYIIMYYCV